MTQSPYQFRGLSNNLLKVIAAISMVIDHVGYLFFPRLEIFRILGRLAFPIFAYMIYEGYRHTRSKLRYFTQIFLLGLLCFFVQLLFDGLYFNVLITFSLSIALMLLLDFLANEKNALKFGGGLLALTALLGLLIYTNEFLSIRYATDYGFIGVMLPVFPRLCDLFQENPNRKFLFLDVRFYLFALSVLLLAIDDGGRQYFGLLALLPLAFYNNKLGFKLPKYSFYLFYPAHLAILWGIWYVMRIF